MDLRFKVRADPPPWQYSPSRWATADVAITAPAEYAASAQGALNSARQAGAALGVAILGSLTSLHAVGTILAVLSVLIVAATLRRREREPAQSGQVTGRAAS